MDSAPAFKAFQVISGIRHLAALATGIKDLREYNQALLYESVFMATLNRLRDTVRQRALLSAALLADHMTKRTGLLNRQPSMPRLETAQLTRAGTQARRQLDHHQAHLTACYRTTELIAGLYLDNPPAELVEGVRQLQQERQRVQMLKARLNPGND
jgi:hypothetical protein